MGRTMTGRRINRVIRYIVLTLIAVYTLFPLYFLFVNSFKSQAQIVINPLQPPEAFSAEYLTNAIEQISFFESFITTLLLTVTALALIIVVSSLAAWAMVRNRTRASTIVFLAFTAAMLIPFQSVMFPLVNLFDQIGLKNFPGLVLMYGGFGLSMSVFLYNGFMKGVPRSLEEAAFIDGASVLQVYLNVVMPLVRSTTVTVVILNGIWIWNDYLLPFLVVANQPRKTLTLSLYFAQLTSGQYGSPFELVFPAVLVTILPVIVAFMFLQKQIMAGVTEGAVKG